jgi:hypothetical protein
MFLDYDVYIDPPLYPVLFEKSVLFIFNFESNKVMQVPLQLGHILSLNFKNFNVL